MKLFNRSSYDQSIESPTAMFFVVLVAALALIYVVLSSFFTVSPGERAFIVTFGNIGSEVYDSGFHFKNPLADTVKMNVQTRKIESSLGSSSSDSQNVNIKVAVNWNIIPSEVRKIRTDYQNSDGVENNIVNPAIQAAIKTASAQFAAENLLKNRVLLGDKMLEVLRAKLDKTGTQVTAINVLDIDFSKSFNDAIEKKVAAEQLAQQAKNDLVRIEFEGQQTVVTAEAAKKAIIAKAQGEAEAIKIQAAAIQVQGGSDYIELKRIEKWKGDVPTMVTNGTPILNIK